jgi:hypothetical protein
MKGLVSQILAFVSFSIEVPTTCLWCLLDVIPSSHKSLLLSLGPADPSPVGPYGIPYLFMSSLLSEHPLLSVPTTISACNEKAVY